MELIYPPCQVQVLPLPTADKPSEWPDTSGEMLPVVSEKGEVIAKAARSYVHGGSRLLHPVVHLHIINREGELYLQKRSSTKDLLPGYWDTAVGGHVDFGEYIREALYREAHEELGLYDFNPTPISTYVYENSAERELVNVFACVGSYQLRPDNDEVDEGRWWPMSEIEESFGKSVLTPNFEGEFQKIRRSLEALL